MSCKVEQVATKVAFGSLFRFQTLHLKSCLLFALLVSVLSDQPVLAGEPYPAGPEVKRSIIYKTLDDGTNLLADVYLPANGKKLRPTLLMIHGGAWFSGNKVHVAYHARHAAEQGYAVMAINYRLAPRFKFPAQLEDCRDALGWIALHADEYGFDQERVAVYGYSAGAHLACLVGLSQNCVSSEQPAFDSSEKPQAQAAGLSSVMQNASLPPIRAIVAGGAPCEFSWIPDEAKTLAYWLGDSRREVPEIYAAATPLTFVDQGDPPMFLFHGTADRVVPLQSSQKMSARLTEAKVVSRLHAVQEASHIGAFLDETAREKAILFLDEFLRGATD